MSKGKRLVLSGTMQIRAHPYDDESGDDDEKTISTSGVAARFSKKHYDKLEVNYQIIDEEPVDEDNNVLVARWQHKF